MTRSGLAWRSRRAPPAARTDLLYVSPVMPALTSNGLAMRAALVLEALAADHNVHLLVIPPHRGVGRPIPQPEIARWCAGVKVLVVANREHPLFRLIAGAGNAREKLAGYRAYPRPALCRFATPEAVREAAQAFPGVAFSAIHVFRLYMVPFAEPYLSDTAAERPFSALDIDDHESTR